MYQYSISADSNAVLPQTTVQCDPGCDPGLIVKNGTESESRFGWDSYCDHHDWIPGIPFMMIESLCR
jgi:hypothetical protein